MSEIIKSSKKGSLIVLSGPSGSGKDSVCERLKEYNNNFWVSISCTTRSPRKGEEDGINYFFITKDAFKEKVKHQDFLEYAVYNGNYYGTPKDKINEYLNNGVDVILVIEVQGALKIKHKVPEAVFIFLMPPTMKDLVYRLKNRGTETDEKIIKRFKEAYKEINEITKYNYVVINDDLDKAAKKVNAIIESQKCMVERIEEVYLNNPEEEIHELLMENKYFKNNDINLE